MPANLPIMDIVAYPVHVLYVPMRLAVLNTVVHGILMVAAINLFDGGALIGLIFTAILAHGYMAYRFKLDPHIEGVWRIKYITGRRYVWNRTRNLVRFPGNKYVAW